MTDVDPKLAALLASARAAAKTAEQTAELYKQTKDVEALQVIRKAEENAMRYHNEAKDLVFKCAKTNGISHYACTTLAHSLVVSKIGACLARIYIADEAYSPSPKVTRSDFPLLAEEWDLTDRAGKDPDGWQPIATAPKDGESVDLWDGKQVNIGYWSIDRWTDAALFGETINPTHWRSRKPPKDKPNEPPNRRTHPRAPGNGPVAG